MDLPAIRRRAETYEGQAKEDILLLIEQIEKLHADSVCNNYSDVFLQTYESYPNQSSKFLSYCNWRKLQLSGHSEIVLKQLCELYAAKCKRDKTQPKFIRSIASLLSEETKYYEDFLDQVILDPTQEPDWDSKAGKLLRHCEIWELIQLGYSVPLPIELDYRRHFGK